MLGHHLGARHLQAVKALEGSQGPALRIPADSKEGGSQAGQGPVKVWVCVQDVPWTQQLLRAPLLAQTLPLAPEEVDGEALGLTEPARGSGGNGRIAN